MTRPCTARAGYTLLEIMIVVVVLGLLATLVVPRIMGRPEEARRTKAIADLASVAQALNLYRLDNGGYPTTDGLELRWRALVRSDSLSALTPAGRDALVAYGVRTIVDLTTVDLDRDVALVAEIARRAGCNIIVATGCWWRPPRYFASAPIEWLVELWTREIREGIGGTGIRADNVGTWDVLV